MASTLQSPGVEIQERDLTLGSIETVEVNVGGLVGAFEKGPILTPIRISSEAQLIEQFGEPTNANAEDWWTAASFLQYGGVLEVVRTQTTGQLTASDQPTGGSYTLSIPTKEIYETVNYIDSTNTWHWAARNIGADGNAIKVSVIDQGADVTLTLDGALGTSTIGTQIQTTSGNAGGAKSGFVYDWDSSTNKVSLITSDTWTTADVIENGATDLNITAKVDWYDTQVAFPNVNWSSIAPRPGTSPYVSDRGGANDEMHIVVYDSTGAITGAPNTLLEKFTFVSKANDAKTSSGAINYYPTVILNQSEYVYWGKHMEDGYDVSGNVAINNGDPNFEGSVQDSNPSTTTFDLFSNSKADREFALSRGADNMIPTASQIIGALEEFRDTETLEIDYLLMGSGDPVSYTHLTLPTSDLV